MSLVNVGDFGASAAKAGAAAASMTTPAEKYRHPIRPLMSPPRNEPRVKNRRHALPTCAAGHFYSQTAYNSASFPAQLSPAEDAPSANFCDSGRLRLDRSARVRLASGQPGAQFGHPTVNF